MRLELIKSFTVKNNLPKNLKQNDVKDFERIGEYLLPDVYLLKIKGANVLADGTIFRRLIPVVESFSLVANAYLKNHNWKGLFKVYLTFKKVQLNAGVNYLVAHNAREGYFHWLVETIPRLIACQPAINDFTLLLPARFKDKFYTETLNILGVNKVEYLQDYMFYSAENLFLSTHTASQANYNPFIIAEVKKRFLKSVKSLTSSFGFDKIYISRAKAKKRKVLNEDEVIEMLDKKGFKSLFFEDLSFQEQVLICNNARYLIGIHGAGLTNLIFMEPGSKVLELRKFDNGLNYFFFTLASVANVDYYYQYCEANNSELSVQDADIWVDIEQLKKNVEMMLAPVQ